MEKPKISFHACPGLIRSLENHDPYMHRMARECFIINSSSPSPLLHRRDQSPLLLLLPYHPVWHRAKLAGVFRQHWESNKHLLSVAWPEHPWTTAFVAWTLGGPHLMHLVRMIARPNVQSGGKWVGRWETFFFLVFLLVQKWVGGD